MRQGEAIEVTRTSEAELTPALAKEILRLQREAFPGAGVFLRQRWYGVPSAGDDVWFTARKDGRLVASVRLLHRKVRSAGGPLTVGGIANVCSSPAARGTGAARACMEAAQEYLLRGGRTDWGVLFCRDRVRDYYAKLGWTAVANPVLERKEGGEPSPLADRNAMIYPGRRAASDWPEGPIDLDGPRW